MRPEAMRRAIRGVCLSLLLLPGLAAAQAGPPAAATKTAAGLPRFLVYFDDWSAYLSPRSKKTIAAAARQAKAEGASAITVQARASVIGTKETNMYLAETRSSIVADQLEADGIARAMIKEQPIGQTGSTDPSAYDRRVDVILHH